MPRHLSVSNIWYLSVKPGQPSLTYHVLSDLIYLLFPYWLLRLAGSCRTFTYSNININPRKQLIKRQPTLPRNFTNLKPQNHIIQSFISQFYFLFWSIMMELLLIPVELPSPLFTVQFPLKSLLDEQPSSHLTCLAVNTRDWSGQQRREMKEQINYC